MDRITALYARVSSERQADEGTIESQLDALRTFAIQQGWTVDANHEFVDNGVSGATLDRPALDRLRDAIAAGEVQRVIVLSPDRLSRNFVHQEYLREEWAKAGCELVYVQGAQIVTPQDLLVSRVQGVFAEYERLVFLERIRRGLLYRARQGEPPAPAPWGYRYLPAENGFPARWEIVPEQAEWVRTIYRWVGEEHLGVRAVARRLTEYGVPPPRGGGAWCSSTVQRILTNPAYRGEALYHRTGRDGEGPAGGSERKKRPPEEWIPIPVPAIVSVEEWEMVQEELERHRRLAQRHARPRRAALPRQAATRSSLRNSPVPASWDIRAAERLPLCRDSCVASGAPTGCIFPPLTCTSPTICWWARRPCSVMSARRALPLRRAFRNGMIFRLPWWTNPPCCVRWPPRPPRPGPSCVLGRP